jgi:hypothetical protein
MQSRLLSHSPIVPRKTFHDPRRLLARWPLLGSQDWLPRRSQRARYPRRHDSDVRADNRRCVAHVTGCDGCATRHDRRDEVGKLAQHASCRIPIRFDLDAGPEGHMEPGQDVSCRDRWQEQAFGVEEGLVTVIIRQKNAHVFSLPPLTRYQVYSREYLTFVSDHLPRAISIIAWCT